MEWTQDSEQIQAIVLLTVNSMLTCTAWQFRVRIDVPHFSELFKLDKHV